jgi:hypothetical protein
VPILNVTFKLTHYPEVGTPVGAGVCGPRRFGPGKAVLPAHTLVAVACSGEDEAHFICGMLNSSPARLAVAGYIALHPSPHILEHISVPEYWSGDSLKKQMVELSKACHDAAARGEESRVAQLQGDVDAVAAEVWGVSGSELRAIQGASMRTALLTLDADEASSDGDD